MSELYDSLFKKWREEHYQQRHIGKREGNFVRDPSCEICFPVDYIPCNQFNNFWDWYQTITPAETYSKHTVRQIESLIVDTQGVIELDTTGIKKKLEIIVGSIYYKKKPGKTSREIY